MTYYCYYVNRLDLPNTPGNEFTVENAYAADGQTLDYTANPNDSRNSNNKSWTDKASDVVNDVKAQGRGLSGKAGHPACLLGAAQGGGRGGQTAWI